MFVLYSDVPFNAKKQPIFLEVNCIPLVFPTFNLWTSPCGKSLWIVNVSEMWKIVKGLATCVGNLKDCQRIGNVPEIPVLRGGTSEVGRVRWEGISPALHARQPTLQSNYLPKMMHVHPCCICLNDTPLFVFQMGPQIDRVKGCSKVRLSAIPRLSSTN